MCFSRYQKQIVRIIRKIDKSGRQYATELSMSQAAAPPIRGHQKAAVGDGIGIDK